MRGFGKYKKQQILKSFLNLSCPDIVYLADTWVDLESVVSNIIWRRCGFVFLDGKIKNNGRLGVVIFGSRISHLKIIYKSDQRVVL